MALAVCVVSVSVCGGCVCGGCVWWLCVVAVYGGCVWGQMELTFTTPEDSSSVSLNPAFAVKRSSFSFAESDEDSTWGGGVPPPDGGRCYDCVKMVMDIQTTFRIGAPNMQYFPFDRHRFRTEIRVNDVNFFSCEHLVAELNGTHLQTLIGNEWIAESISGEHPTVGSVDERNNACILELTVRRDRQIFVVKQ
jgi:hypothetical protein